MLNGTLHWRTVTQSNDPKFLVKGTELAVALAGRYSRFQICEIRCYDEENYADRRHVVRDAHTVSDQDLREGRRPEIVYRCDTVDQALEYIKNVEAANV